ncbi:hypothetical protein [Billgrantia ethanolica]|uniref:Uncharacterized protein n=1 Tax=Billgrantia ethanolica TaxID=2733486 RepID=A0ABS9A1L2_9GAMM|nr:hypothetical protein [Halomonas ethanolica]MCE8002714.1 hypothetical protein [Halomonas ethanolica]
MKRIEFDPYQWAREGYCEDPHQNPGELIRSCVSQVEQLRLENPRNREIAQRAVDFANLVAGIVDTWPGSDDEEQNEKVRKTIVGAYLMGLEAASLAVDTRTMGTSVEEAIEKLKKEGLRAAAKAAADARHNKPGGSRELKEKIRAIWATGKYSSRDICAEEEWAALGYKSFAAARKALRNTKDPT